MKKIRIGTRKSRLALWQAQYVRAELSRLYSDIDVELVEIVCEGDKIPDIPLSRMGGKGLFLKELESALLGGDVDLAVHSMKDVTVALPEGLHISAFCPREDPRDALVSNRFENLESLPPGSVVGTCSLRRQCQIRAAYPHLRLKNLRGNIDTRLRKLDEGEYDAVILAAAGLKRLGMKDRIGQSIPTSVCLPAVGQGVIGIECRMEDGEISGLIAPLNDETSANQVLAERAANERLGGGCHVPVALYCRQIDDALHMEGRVGSPDGSVMLKSTLQAKVGESVQLGIAVAEELIDRGAKDILEEIYSNAG